MSGASVLLMPGVGCNRPSRVTPCLNWSLTRTVPIDSNHASASDDPNHIPSWPSPDVSWRKSWIPN